MRLQKVHQRRRKLAEITDGRTTTTRQERRLLVQLRCAPPRRTSGTPPPGLFAVDHQSGGALHVLQPVGVEVHQERPHARPQGGEGQLDGDLLSWGHGAANERGGVMTPGGRPTDGELAATHFTWTWVSDRSPAPSIVNTPPLRGTGRGLVKDT